MKATPIAICHNRGIDRLQVFKKIARRGKTSMGWFYNFKLHLVVNDWSDLLAFYATPRNVDAASLYPSLPRR